MAVAFRAQSRGKRATMAKRDAAQVKGDKPLSTEQDAGGAMTRDRRQRRAILSRGVAPHEML